MTDGKNSMLYWWPLVAPLGIPIPRTHIVRIDEGVNLYAVLDGGLFPEELLNKIVQAGDRVGWPCFIRGDLASAKHQWINSCWVPHPEDIGRHLYSLVEFTALVMIPSPDAFVIRELLPIQALFTAFEGLPIGRERRYFVHQGRVVCHHPYWPEEAITSPSDPNWRNLLGELSVEDDDEVVELTRYAEAIGGVLPGEWSVDFAFSQPQGWIFIDAALAEHSWHPAHL